MAVGFEFLSALNLHALHCGLFAGLTVARLTPALKASSRLPGTAGPSRRSLVGIERQVDREPATYGSLEKSGGCFVNGVTKLEASTGGLRPFAAT